MDGDKKLSLVSFDYSSARYQLALPSTGIFCFEGYQ